MRPAALCLALLLAACGGGGSAECEDDAQQRVTPPDCTARPELCA